LLKITIIRLYVYGRISKLRLVEVTTSTSNLFVAMWNNRLVFLAWQLLGLLGMYLILEDIVSFPRYWHSDYLLINCITTLTVTVGVKILVCKLCGLVCSWNPFGGGGGNNILLKGGGGNPPVNNNAVATSTGTPANNNVQPTVATSTDTPANNNVQPTVATSTGTPANNNVQPAAANLNGINAMSNTLPVFALYSSPASRGVTKQIPMTMANITLGTVKHSLRTKCDNS
jgi:hypothetical protein